MKSDSLIRPKLFIEHLLCRDIRAHNCLVTMKENTLTVSVNDFARVKSYCPQTKKYEPKIPPDTNGTQVHTKGAKTSAKDVFRVHI